MTNILITGAGSVMGQSIFRALDLHEFDEPARIHFANSEPIAAGRHFKPERLEIEATPMLPLANDPQFTPAVEDYVQRHGIDVIFAGTQHELMKLAELRDRKGGVATLAQRTALLCVDKSRTNDVLRAAGLETPQDQVFADWLERPDVEGAVIVKPKSSSASRNIIRIRGGRADERAVDDALTAIGSMQATEFVVQSLLEGEEYTCGCYVDRYSGQAATIVMRRTLTADGATLYGEIVQDDSIDDYVRGCAAALKPHGFDFGHINVQLMLTSRGPIAFEINGRLSSTERPKAVLGFNSCAAYFENIVRERPFSFDAISTQGRFIRYYDEIYF